MTANLQHPGMCDEGTLQLATVSTSDATLLRLRGELDMSTSPIFREAIEGLEIAPNLVIDLRDLEFIDSSGLRLFQELVAAQRSKQGEVLFASPSPAVRRVFDIIGLDRLPGARVANVR